MKQTFRTAAALGLALGLSAGAFAANMTGAGSTFIYPLMSKWSYEYAQKNGTQVNYQSIGSGGGIQQLLNRTVDFGASDAPMSPEMMSKASGPILHLPATMGAVVVTYNVDGLASGLKLDGPTLADIFLGNITKWNDPAIAKLNGDMNLPDSAITIVHRADGSGTTNIFTDFLTKVSTAWAGTVGKGTAVKWPVGVGGKGNEAVAGLVRKVPGSIGYVELAYVLQNKMSYALIKNKAGKYPEPSIESTSAAAEGALAKMPADFRVSFTNASGAESYPICGFTWILVYQKQDNAVQGKTLVDFLNWLETDGQNDSAGLHYAPLPASLVEKIQASIKSIKF
jgi:phosphate transport system substrate-binding protein